MAYNLVTKMQHFCHSNSSVEKRNSAYQICQDFYFFLIPTFFYVVSSLRNLDQHKENTAL